MRRFSAATAAAGLVLALAAAPAATADTADTYTVQPSPAITPGAGVGVYDAAGRAANACTLGFLATGEEGGRYALTAGHCASAGSVVMRYQKADNYIRLGRFVHSIDNSTDFSADFRDLGLVALADDLPPLEPRISGKLPVTGVTSELTPDDTLCVVGARTGEQKCGRVRVRVAPGDTDVLFNAPSQPGDSGAPVYRLNPDGTATAVGVAVLGSPEETTAMLIEPFLQQWNLDLDIEPAPGGVARSMRTIAALIGLSLIGGVLGAARWITHRRRPAAVQNLISHWSPHARGGRRP